MREGTVIRQGQFVSPRALVRRFSPAVESLLRQSGAKRAPSPASWPAGDPAMDNGTLGRMGALEVRLAASAGEVHRAQALRYQVFYGEMAAVPDRRTQQLRRDADHFDTVCDHLIVLDHARRKRDGLLRLRPEMVGTYRLLRQEVAERHGGFYSVNEYDVAPLLASKPRLRFLELGRSCVMEAYRTRRTVELLWHGIWAYVLKHRIDVMLGCASLPGADPEQLALPLTFLHHTARAPAEWRVQAHPHRYVEMNRLPASEVDGRRALRALPPLLKGYLRLGAYVGDGAVVDRQFGTTDVCVILPVERIAARYVEHYGAEATRYGI